MSCYGCPYQTYRGAQGDKDERKAKHEAEAVKQGRLVACPGFAINGGDAGQVSQVGRHQRQHTRRQEGKQPGTESKSI